MINARINKPIILVMFSLMILLFMVGRCWADAVEWIQIVPQICSECERIGMGGNGPYVLINDSISELIDSNIIIPGDECGFNYYLQMDSGDCALNWFRIKWMGCGRMNEIDSIWAYFCYDGINNIVITGSESLIINGMVNVKIDDDDSGGDNSNNNHIGDNWEIINNGEIYWFDIIGNRVDIDNVCDGIYFSSDNNRLIKIGELIRIDGRIIK